MSGDSRGWRIALLPDSLLNPPQSRILPGVDVLEALQASGYGLLHLPPRGDHRLLLAVIADQVAEYSHHGYAVVVVGLDGTAAAELHWRRLARLLRERGVALPPRHFIRPDGDVASEAQRLKSFLEGYDLPVGEQRRWRG